MIRHKINPPLCSRWSWLLLALLLTSCTLATTPAPEPIFPTRTPLPTFTPTLAQAGGAPVAEAATATATQAAPPAANTPAPVAPTAVVTVTTPVTQTTPVTPTAAPTPTPQAPEVIVSNPINIRGGPGTNYNILGGAQPGTRFAVKGKSPDGAWWQIDYNGRDGWVFGQLVSAQNVGAVAVAQNIPAPPPPTATPPPPPPTQPPPAQQPTQPPPPPSKKYKFNVAVVSKCLPQEGGNWFEGKTYVGAQPQNGHKVVFSYAPDGPPATSPVMSGPHPGYTNWDTGYYSHIINSGKPQAGNWFAWVVDDAGQRISEIGNWQFTGPSPDSKNPTGCNQVVVDFDSR